MVKRGAALLAAGLLLAGLLGACSKVELPAYLRPLSKDTMMLLGKKDMELKSPIFVRVFKEESELELWKARADGRFYHFKTYPICNWSGDLGPKFRQGDRQAPEGFYTVPQHQMNPNSSYHLAFNLGYPNAYDKANRRTGNFLMIHGKCTSAGCYAMTDALIEEIYAIARESFIGGQEHFHVHAFPFRMSDANLERHKASPHIRFWRTLKEGYDHFELTRQVPEVVVCERRYVVNAKVNGRGRANPEGYCPQLVRPKPEPFVQQALAGASPDVVVQGPRMRVSGGATVIDTSQPVPVSRPVASGGSGLGGSGLGGSGLGFSGLGSVLPQFLGRTP